MKQGSGKGHGRPDYLVAITESAKKWGEWMRRPADGWPRTTILSRVKDYGNLSSAVKAHSRDWSLLPDRYQPDHDALLFHRVWAAAEEIDQALIYVGFAMRAPWPRKEQLLKRAQICNSRSRFYEMRKEALRNLYPAWLTKHSGNLPKDRNNMVESGHRQLS